MPSVPDQDSLVGARGTRLHLRVWPAHGSVRGRVILVHGLGEHAGRYQHVADSLVDRGFGVVAFDLRGHGMSEGGRGCLRSFGLFLEDLRLVLEYTERRLPGRTPPFLYGHSLGGLIVLRYAQDVRSPSPGVVLSAPWLGTAQPIPWWTRVAASLLSQVAPDLALSRPHANPRILTGDPEMQEAYLRDPLVHHTLSPRFFREVERAQARAFEAELDPTLPVLVLAPLEDGLVETEATLRWSESLIGRTVRVVRLPKTRHEPHNDLDRDGVLRRVGSWLLERAASAEGRTLSSREGMS